MALLGVALAASLMGKLSQKHGGKDLADQALSSAFRFGTRTRTFFFNPIARTITYLTGNQWHLGRNLPYLEVPSLLESAKRVQERAKLELSSPEFEKFKLDLEAFLDSGAYTLQAKLHALSCVDPVSWIDRFWEAMYLYGRDCPIERASWIGYGRRNPSNLDRFTGNDKFLVRVACLLTSAMNYRRELVAGTLRENMVFSFGSANASIPIDAAKCLRTFGTYRLPGVECDRFVDHPNSTHIVVLYKGRTYVLNLMYENRMKTSEELYVNLHAILNDSSGEGGFNVNVLTTQKRKDWAEDRETLRGVGNNGAMMDILESALFAVCIDQDATWTNNEEAALHGFTHRQDRNFDLPFQVCCMPDGNFYEICAHGPFDATHVAPFLEYCFRHEDDLLARFEKPEITQPHDFTDQTQDGNDFHPAILRFAEPADIRTKLQQLDSVPLNPGLDIKEFVFTGFGKELLKAGGHPDSVIQMAFQLAYALMHRGDHPQVLGVNTYEALSARHFHGCRTFQGHPRSVASEAFVSKMLARDASGDVTTDVIDALCNGVNTLSLDSATTLKGFSEDRHLFALYCLSLMNGKTPPEFLRTSMETLTKYKLSTSQVRQDFGEGGIFRPSERDGYGLLYRINLDGEIRVSISSYVKESGKTAIDFAGFLRQALELMEPVLRKRQVK